MLFYTITMSILVTETLVTISGEKKKHDHCKLHASSADGTFKPPLFHTWPTISIALDKYCHVLVMKLCTMPHENMAKVNYLAKTICLVSHHISNGCTKEIDKMR